MKPKSECYKSFDDLPSDIQKRIKVFASSDVESWVRAPIPALGGKSLLEQLNAPDGYDKVCQYLIKVEGYLR